jgi:uncharacterized protein (DUF58 family)
MKALATALLPLLIVFAPPGARTLHAAVAVKLTVKPSAPRYKLGDKVTLTVTLTNRGKTSATVSAFAMAWTFARVAAFWE